MKSGNDKVFIYADDRLCTPEMNAKYRNPDRELIEKIKEELKKLTTGALE